MQTADQSKKGPDPTAPPPYPGVGQTGSYAGGFVAPPVGPGYDGAPPVDEHVGAWDARDKPRPPHASQEGGPFGLGSPPPKKM